MAAFKNNKGRLSTEDIQNMVSKSKVRDHSISRELETSFMEYAMSVIVSRALPDARDGLKPVHRRVLYSAYNMGMTHDKPYKKSARLVGDILGKYHPHGDSAVYQAMVRFAQDFSMRYPLIDGHGNFGSVDGDEAAAMRYTEARLAKISGELIRNIDKDTVDFVENYDGSEMEPSVLPGLLPNLLVNGSTGIAVGMATNIPPHNLTETCNAIVALIDNPEITLDELMVHIKGPDFPTKAEILGDKGIRDYFATGRGTFTLRSKYKIEESPTGKKSIIITEIPYLVNKSKLIDRIVELHKEQIVDGMTDLRDESARDDIRLVIEIRRDIVPEVLLNKLFKMTNLQTNTSVNYLALVDGAPQILDLTSALNIYIKHQLDVLNRKTKYDLKKAEDRAHILEGLIIATTNIEEVIKIIRGAANSEVAVQELMSKFKLTEIQSKAILEMRIRSLSGLEREKIQNEHKELLLAIAEYKSILESKEKQLGIIKELVINLRDKFGDERKTHILYGVNADIEDEDLIPQEDVIITMSRRGYLKRLPIDYYRTQKRGGVGKQALKTYDDDDVEKIVIANTHIDLLIFTTKGKIYRIRGHQIPPGSAQAKGTFIKQIIPDIEKDENVLQIITADHYEDRFLFFVTQKGTVKRVKMEEFARINRNGKKAILLHEDDKLMAVHKTTGQSEIFIGASSGMCVRFNENDVRVMGRAAAGVRGIRLESNQTVVGSDTSENGKYVLSVGAKGVGKLSDKDQYRLTSRGAKGVTTLKTNSKTGGLVGLKLVNGDESMLLITTTGKIIRTSLETVSVIGRSTSGVKLMAVNDNERIQAIGVFKEPTPEEVEEVLETAEHSSTEQVAPVDINNESDGE